MDKLNFTPIHKKGQHLTRDERSIIFTRLTQDKCSVYKIAKELNRSYNTINNEIKRGTVNQYHG